MKILYVTSGHVLYPHGNLNRYIVTALRNLPDQSQVYELNPQVNWLPGLLQVMEQYRPDYVFTIHGQFFSEKVVQMIRQRGARFAMWFVDDPYDVDGSKSRLFSYDYIFTTERNCVPVYQRHGYSRVYSIMFGTQSGFFFPEDPEPGYQSDVCLVGSPFNGRIGTMRYVLQKLPGVRFQLVGPNWNMGNFPNVQVVNRPITPEEVRKFYNGAKINLNIYRIFNESLHGGTLNSEGITASSPNARTFDIAACRAFQICTERPEILAYFDTSTEMITVQNDSDLVSKIKHYLNHADQRHQIAERAYQKTINRFRLENSLTQMFEIIKRDLSREGHLIKGAETPCVFLVRNGMKCPLPSIEVFDRLGFRWENVAIIAQAQVDEIPEGPVIW